MMNAAAPEGTPPRRINDYTFSRSSTDPPCLGEALRRVIIILNIISTASARHCPFTCFNRAKGNRNEELIFHYSIAFNIILKKSECWFLLQCRDQQPDASLNIFGVQDFNGRVDIP